MTNIVKPTKEVTMTSLELVDFINSQRGESESTLRHDDFLRKVPLVLGEDGARKFTATYRIQERFRRFRSLNIVCKHGT